MKRKVSLFLIVIVLLMTTIPSFASEEKVIYKEIITVTEDGGKFNIGFTEVKFKKNFIEKDRLPKTFEVKIYAENGQAYIEFLPDTSGFKKDVIIKVNEYKGLLYDIALGKNIEVNIKKQKIKAEHFSRYCLY